MRALLITTFADLHDPPLQQVIEILRRTDVEPVTSGSLGAGSYLRERLQPDIGIGIVILPHRFAEKGGSLALMVEAGICLGADIPLLTIIHPNEKLPPALSSVRHVKARLDDTDALQLHLGMFIQSAASLKTHHLRRSPQHLVPSIVLPPAMDDAGRRTQLGYEFVDQVAALLRAAGKEPVLGQLDYGVDIAFAAGDDAPFVVVVQAKMIGPQAQARPAVERLLEYVDRSGSGLGLLITDEPALDSSSYTGHPTVLLLSINDLGNIVANGDLDKRIRRARNRIVHQG